MLSNVDNGVLRNCSRIWSDRSRRSKRSKVPMDKCRLRRGYGSGAKLPDLFPQALGMLLPGAMAGVPPPRLGDSSLQKPFLLLRLVRQRRTSLRRCSVLLRKPQRNRKQHRNHKLQVRNSAQTNRRIIKSERNPGFILYRSIRSLEVQWQGKIST